MCGKVSEEIERGLKVQRKFEEYLYYGSTRASQNGSREINLSEPIKIIKAQPVQPTRLPDPGNRIGYSVAPAPTPISEKPGSKEHDALYEARSCAWSFINDMSPL
jgi:hypothetical protein